MTDLEYATEEVDSTPTPAEAEGPKKLPEILRDSLKAAGVEFSRLQTTPNFVYIITRPVDESDPRPASDTQAGEFYDEVLAGLGGVEGANLGLGKLELRKMSASLAVEDGKQVLVARVKVLGYVPPTRDPNSKTAQRVKAPRPKKADADTSTVAQGLDGSEPVKKQKKARAPKGSAAASAGNPFAEEGTTDADFSGASAENTIQF